jgi:hypothetical protein
LDVLQEILLTAVDLWGYLGDFVRHVNEGKPQEEYKNDQQEHDDRLFNMFFPKQHPQRFVPGASGGASNTSRTLRARESGVNGFWIKFAFSSNSPRSKTSASG